VANVFINLPLPAGNGVGPAVLSDVLGKDKTVVVGGSFPKATITIEASVDGGLTWGQITTFQDGDGKTRTVAVIAQFMRTRVSGRNSALPFVGVNVDVGGNNNGTLFAALPVPATPGPGVSVDVSAFGAFKTVITGGGSFSRSTISVQISEDGISWAFMASFGQPDLKSFTAAARFMRAFVTGPGAGGVVAAVGSEQAGGGDGSLEIQDEGLFVGDRPILNFIGINVVAADDPPNNRVNVTITGDPLEVQDEGVLVGSRPILNFIGPGVTAADNPGQNRVDVTVLAAIVTGAVPTQIDVGDAGLVGVSLEAARADHQHALPVPAAPVDVDTAPAAAGVATTAARSDHKHDVATAVPVDVTGALNVEGVALGLARADHQHRLEVEVEDESVLAGARPTLNFLGAGVTAVDNPGTDAVDITVTAANVTVGGVPEQIDIGDAAVIGVSVDAAHADHQHPFPAPPAPETVTGAVNGTGVATTAARSDHQHRLGLRVDEEGVLVGARPELNFIGAGVTAVDNPGLDRVDVTIPGSASDGSAILGFGAGNINAAANTRFLDPWYGGNTSVALLTITDHPCPRAGTLKNLFVRHNAADGNGNTVVYTVMLNGVATLLTVTLATGAIGQASDLVNSVVVAQGDRIGLRAVKALAIGGASVLVQADMELTV
jgi:hypothetical protein